MSWQIFIVDNQSDSVMAALICAVKTIKITTAIVCYCLLGMFAVWRSELPVVKPCTDTECTILVRHGSVEVVKWLIFMME